MNIQKILEDHTLWLTNEGGKRANLQWTNLQGTNLQGANLQWANLEGANLQGTNLKMVNLQGANLQGANLKGANLKGAKLEWTNLQGTNLQKANLKGATLKEANLQGANLEGAKLPHFQICPEQGAFEAWKKTSKGVVRLLIPADAERTSNLVGRKCRASHVVVLDGPGCGGKSPTVTFSRKLFYEAGETIKADNYNDDIRIECTGGIHFFMTKREAEEWG